YALPGGIDNRRSYCQRVDRHGACGRRRIRRGLYIRDSKRKPLGGRPQALGVVADLVLVLAGYFGHAGDLRLLDKIDAVFVGMSNAVRAGKLLGDALAFFLWLADELYAADLIKGECRRHEQAVAAGLLAPH